MLLEADSFILINTIVFSIIGFVIILVLIFSIVIIIKNIKPDLCKCCNQGDSQQDRVVTISSKTDKKKKESASGSKNKGRPQLSLEKIPKISASCRNYLDPLPHSSKKGPTNENVKVIIKFVFSKFQPPLPPFHQKVELHRFCQLRWHLTRLDSILPLRSILILFLIHRSRKCLWRKKLMDTLLSSSLMTILLFR